MIAPLDWGLGHATRCVPIIRELLRRHCDVLLAGSGDSLLLLQQEFPQLKFFTLPGYRPVYSSGTSLVWKMAIQLPKFFRVIKKEHDEIETIIDNHQIDFIISDNRYGCWSRKIPSAIITHQLNILLPKGFGWLSMLVRSLNQKLIGNFSCCWIPDYKDPALSLSGELSKHDKVYFHHIEYIGPLSRFTAGNSGEPVYDIACILSGPEPQRSIFEKKLSDQLKGSNLRHFVVRGNVSQKNLLQLNEADFLTSDALETIMAQSSSVIARSGYSTIMDLAVMGKKGILVPTPGQTEQEYLARRWADKGVFFTMPQHEFDLETALQQSKQYTGLSVDGNGATDLLTNALDQFLNHREK